ncbi:MAG: DUF1192 domain-containing protein [Alphaproteobacteria bacterium]|nr:DUF1192 domain-containing protein [Alphaproteobacteria bacterium SS10]
MSWDEPPKPKPTLTVGMPLDTVSVGELEEMVEEFKAEIERLEAEITKKRSQKSAADAFFKS